MHGDIHLRSNNKKCKHLVLCVLRCQEEELRLLVLCSVLYYYTSQNKEGENNDPAMLTGTAAGTDTPRSRPRYGSVTLCLCQWWGWVIIAFALSMHSFYVYMLLWVGFLQCE